MTSWKAPRPGGSPAREWAWGSYGVRVVALAAAYFLVAELGFELATVHESVSLVWPPTGLSLAVLLLFGVRLWPGVALGAYLANALGAAGPLAAAGIALGNTLEAVTGVLLLRHLAGFRESFDRPYDAVAFVLLGAVLSPVVSATMGVASLCLAGQAAWSDYGFLWSLWWLGNAVGAVVVAPLILAFAGGAPANGAGRTGEAVALLLLLVGVAYGVFAGGDGSSPRGFPFSYAVFPFVIWAALALGLRGAACATAVISAIAISATVLGRGPFSSESVTHGLVPLHAFVAVVALTGLVLSAALAHRSRIQEAAARLAAIVESSDDAIIEKTPDGVIVSWNRGAQRLYGYAPEEVIGKPISILVPPERREELSWIMQRVLRGEHIPHHETVRLKKDGTWLHVSLSVWPIEDQMGHVVSISAIARDITEQKAAEAALEKANVQMGRWVKDLREKTCQASLLGEMANLLQSCRTSQEVYAVVAQFAPRLFPSSAGMLGLLTAKNAVEAVAVWGGEAGDEVFGSDQCWALRRGRTHASGGEESVLPCHHISAGSRTAYVCVPMVAAGQPLGVLHVRPDLRDLGLEAPAADAVESCTRLAESTASQVALTLANVKLQETLRGQAIRDSLTGLFNRRYLEEALDRELQRAVREGKPLGVIMIDIDHFKPFNDAHGHELGDLLLAALGNLLRAQVREQDIVCRYGGEEFTILLPEASLEATLQRAREIRDGVRRLPVPSEGRPVGPVTVSLGVAAYPDHGSTGRALLAAADARAVSSEGAGARSARGRRQGGRRRIRDAFGRQLARPTAPRVDWAP